MSINHALSEITMIYQTGYHREKSTGPSGQVLLGIFIFNLFFHSGLHISDNPVVTNLYIVEGGVCNISTKITGSGEFHMFLEVDTAGEEVLGVSYIFRY